MNDQPSMEFSTTLKQLSGKPGSLIPLLQACQQHYGYIPKDSIKQISKATDIAISQVYGVITFYEQFRLSPIGKNVIRVCVGTACHVNKAKMLVDTLEEILGIPVGKTTSDGIFSLFTVACLGCCSLAPVMMINDDTHGGLTPAAVRKIINKIKRQEKENNK